MLINPEGGLMNCLLNDHGRKAVLGVADLVIVEDKRQR